jgi:hypothetical protein
MLVLDITEILPPLGKYKYDTWRMHPVKCYIDNSMRLRSCIRNINNEPIELPLKHLYIGLPHGLGSFMSHPESGPHIFSHIQAIHTVELFLVN